MTTNRTRLREVQSTVDATWKVRDVNIEGKLFVLELEHLVGRTAGVHEVVPASNVGASLEPKSQGIARSSDTVRARVVGTIDSAVGSASRSGRADRTIKCVSSVAVRVATGGVQPAPVRVQSDLGVERGASRSRAL